MWIFRTVFIAALSSALLAACSAGDASTSSTNSSTNSSNNSSKAPTPSGPKLEGTYRFDFDGTQQLAGGAPKPAKSRSRIYAVRSTCTDAGCIATATKLADDDPKRKSDPPLDLVLDYIDGSWQMALREDTTCTDSAAKGPSLTAWTLQPQPDGTLNGTSYVAMNPSPDCAVATQTPVVVRRVSDVGAGISVADPGKQQPLSPSAPGGLSGPYDETSVLHDSPKPGRRRVDMQTMCVRNTDQCATFKSYQTASGTEVVNALLFKNGKWQLDQHTNVNCPNGATAGTVKHEEYALPQPVAHPLPRVTGTIRLDAADSCPAQQLDITLERTGT